MNPSDPSIVYLAENGPYRIAITDPAAVDLLRDAGVEVIGPYHLDPSEPTADSQPDPCHRCGCEPCQCYRPCGPPGRFSIGDRVVVVNPDLDTYGRTGTIEYLGYGRTMISVELDGEDGTRGFWPESLRHYPQAQVERQGSDRPGR